MPQLSPANLHSIIAQGESATLELKARLPAESIIATIFAAFANSDGGVLIIGVTDQGTSWGYRPRVRT
jgi:predicted HTH transcriptional regulator